MRVLASGNSNHQRHGARLGATHGAPAGSTASGPSFEEVLRALSQGAAKPISRG